MPPPIDPRISLLPDQLRPVAEICGFEGVERLINALGGRRIYVPINGASGLVMEHCGPEVAQALSSCYARDYIVIPLAHQLATARKHAEIRRDPRSATEVARAYHMTVNSIHRIRNGAGPVAKVPRLSRLPDPRQFDLEDYLAKKS